MTYDFSIRAMRCEDLAGVRLVLDSTRQFPSSMVEEMAEPFLSGNAPHLWLVAFSEDRVFGFAYCEPERMTDGTYNLLAIAVASGLQRSGVGAGMVRQVESTFQSNMVAFLTWHRSTFERACKFNDIAFDILEEGDPSFGADRIISRRKEGGDAYRLDCSHRLIDICDAKAQMVGAAHPKVLGKVVARRTVGAVTARDQLDPETARADQIGELSAGKLGDSPALLDRKAECCRIPVDHSLHVIDTVADMVSSKSGDGSNGGHGHSPF
jgi:Acetyltransferase (GNAT) family